MVVFDFEDLLEILYVQFKLLSWLHWGLVGSRKVLGVDPFFVGLFFDSSKVCSQVGL